MNNQKRNKKAFYQFCRNYRFLIILTISIIFESCNPKDPNHIEPPQDFVLHAIKSARDLSSKSGLIIAPNGVTNLSPIYPSITGIPDTLKDVKTYFFPLDRTQALYQAYKKGLVDYSYLKNKLKEDIRDTIHCSEKEIRTFIPIVFGKSSVGKKYYLFDSNNNYNLSDEPIIESLTNSYTNEPKKVLYEKNLNNEVVQDSTWVDFYIFKTDALVFRICEQTSANFNYDSTDYIIRAYPSSHIRAKYGDNTKFEITKISSNEKRTFNQSQYAILNNKYYKVNANIDGRIISFKLDSTALTSESAQVDMPSIPFKSVTVSKDSINFPLDYNGKFVLLDFWSTSCPHCIRDMRGIYMELYEKYGGEKFEIIGIGSNPIGVVSKFTRQNSIQWVMISDPDKAIQKKYHVYAYPGLFLIDPNGKIIAMNEQLRENGLGSMLEKYLNE